MTDGVVQLVFQLGSFGAFGPITLTLAFMVGALVFLPRPVMCWAAGLLFGPWAILMASVGSTAGAVIGFVIARHLARAHFLRVIARRPHWRATLDAVDADGPWLVFLLRFASPIPATVANFAFGLTGIGLVPFTAATFLGTLPQIVLFVLLGMFSHVAWVDLAHAPFQLAILGVGIVITGGVVWEVTRRSRAILAAKPSFAAPRAEPQARA